MFVHIVKYVIMNFIILLKFLLFTKLFHDWNLNENLNLLNEFSNYLFYYLKQQKRFIKISKNQRSENVNEIFNSS